jgi:hypothetical protein
MPSSTAELRLAVQEMVAANDIVQVYLNPALLYGEDGAGNNDWIPNPLSASLARRRPLPRPISAPFADRLLIPALVRSEQDLPAQVFPCKRPIWAQKRQRIAAGRA